MPFQARSLTFDKYHTYYTPQSDKFIGYTQCPNPRCIPYFNDHRSLKIDLKRQEKIKNIEKQYDYKNKYNSTLYQYKNNKNIGVSFLTGTVIDSNVVQKVGKIHVLSERKILNDLSYKLI